MTRLHLKEYSTVFYFFNILHQILLRIFQKKRFCPVVEAQVWSRNTWQDGPCGPYGPYGHAAVAAKSAAAVRLPGRRLLSDLSDKSDQSDKKARTTHKSLHVSPLKHACTTSQELARLTPKHSAFFEKRWGFGGRKITRCRRSAFP